MLGNSNLRKRSHTFAERVIQSKGKTLHQMEAAFSNTWLRLEARTASRDEFKLEHCCVISVELQGDHE